MTNEEALAKAQNINLQYGWELDDEAMDGLASLIRHGVEPIKENGDVIMAVKVGDEEGHSWAECDQCGNEFRLDGLSPDTMDMVNCRVGLIQDIIPFVQPEWRELLISHTCPCCWERMFGPDED